MAGALAGNKFVSLRVFKIAKQLFKEVTVGEHTRIITDDTPRID